MSAKKKQNILVTGANGFVGKSLVPYLQRSGDRILSAVRIQNRDKIESLTSRIIEIGDINATTNWKPVLKEMDVVIHLASRVHIMDDTVQDPAWAYNQTNVDGTMQLARQALQAGVKRFIFISSIKVIGEYTNEKPFSVLDPQNPVDDYARSKCLAEKKLMQLCKKSDMEFVILRIPLVYGKDMKGNLDSLVKMIKKRMPLPFGCIKNKRDLLGIGNLCDIIKVCIHHKKAANQIFLVSDGTSISTKKLTQVLAENFGIHLILLPVPLWVLKSLFYLIGKKVWIQRLMGNLEIDIEATTRQLKWHPPYTIHESLNEHFYITQP